MPFTACASAFTTRSSRSGDAPGAAALAATLGLHDAEVADAYRALADAHVIVLRAGTLDIAWAPPFSAVPTPFRTACGDASWYAPCAWDAFGIPAALKCDAVDRRPLRVVRRCDPLRCRQRPRLR